MPLDLKANLISEAIGILFTVFFVDRIIRWRNNMKWIEVKTTFLIYAGRYSDKIIDIWEKWLVGLPEMNDIVISKYKKSLNQYVIPTIDSKIRNVLETLKSNLGNPIGSKFRLFLENQKKGSGIQKKVEECLSMYLHILSFSSAEGSKGEKFSKQNLKNELEPLVDKLSNLLDRYPLIINQRFSLPIINLSLAVEDLNLIYDTSSLMEGMVNSIKLHNYIKKEFSKQI